MSDEWFTLRWTDAGVEMLDQRLLPSEERYVVLSSVEEIACAIEDLVIRGAPAIGCAAAMGIARAAVVSQAADVPALLADLAHASERLARTRPTAVNLFWALDHMRDVQASLAVVEGATLASLREGLIAAAQRVLDEDIEKCRAIGDAGVELVPDNGRILTHCNAGALATGGYGTALGVVRSAAASRHNIRVLADETRPYLQGARLTAWELMKDEIPVTVITDNMAGYMMQQGEVDLVIVGSDRIAANGDVANKIGTYTVAVLAHEHDIPFYVAAPVNTIDFEVADGSGIPIEERGRAEIADIGKRPILPDSVPVRHPAFDVTPARLVTAIVSERGVARPPYVESLARWRDA